MNFNEKISLYIPEPKDYWYLSEIQSNPKNMSYNAGFDVTYDGYHYDTGCIDLPESMWESEYKRKQEKGIFIAYVKDEEKSDYIGYVTYHYNGLEDRYYCGVLIEDKFRNLGYSKYALELLLDVVRKNGIKTLYNSFESSRLAALNLFLQAGFKIEEEYTIKKFKKDTKCILIKIKL